jgi:glyoxylase-like metal-dependent hydrolase (beta-lactamase superfamily II)
MCFVHAEAGFVLSGDHVLSTTTPNVSLTSEDDGSPLTDYLTSLRRVEALDGMISLPGHEQRVPVAPRARALIGHHEARLVEAADAVRAGHTTVRAVAERMTWSLPWSQYGSLDNLLAMFETFAHLVVLEERGVLAREKRRSPVAGRISPLRWSA